MHTIYLLYLKKTFYSKGKIWRKITVIPVYYYWYFVPECYLNIVGMLLINRIQIMHSLEYAFWKTPSSFVAILNTNYSACSNCGRKLITISRDLLQMFGVIWHNSTRLIDGLETADLSSDLWPNLWTSGEGVLVYPINPP